ncbi:MAG: UvrD-helicase domain-containing protein [Clostridiales bacterium]|nr:UvrD-helicase domain-containing protein [Clostridiales bacterium]
MTDKDIFDKKYAMLRRELIAREFSALNEAQREAVLHTEGALLVLAGAGSGKTTVLINRISNLIRFGRGASLKTAPANASDDDLEKLTAEYVKPGTLLPDELKKLCAVDPPRPWNILAITFTNKAAGELRERLTKSVGEDAKDIWAMTFHAACARILRRDIAAIGYESRFTIYDEDERLTVLRICLKELGIDEKVMTPHDVSRAISRAKDALQDHETFAHTPPENEYAAARHKDIARIYSLYAAKLRENNALDFDDLIMCTVKLLETVPDVLAHYREKFRYVLVDEYQDTNPAQDRLTQLLASGTGNLCVVGDDDQSIYRFRGATVKNILEFDKTYPDARVIRLEQNYRSTSMILNAANEVIRHNESRRGKKLWTDSAEGEKIGFYSGYDERDEAQYIATQILAGYKKGYTPRDFAVLYRMNAQSNAIEKALAANGIPYRIVGGMRFYDRAEVRDMIAYLCAIVNHDDTMRLRRIVNNPPRRISSERVEDAMEVAGKNGISLFEVMRRAGSFKVFDRAAQPMEQFAQMLEELRLSAETMPLDAFYDLVLEKTGYLAMYEKKKDPESLTRAENVRELRSSIINYAQGAETPSLSGFLEEVALFTDIDRYDDTADAAVLMTLHAAKGLEFPNVFLCGMEEGIFPSQRSAAEPEAMEEERRLAYVGITRAKKKLYITCADSRMIFGRTAYNRPSRFIGEIPEDCLDRVPARRKKQPLQRSTQIQRPERKPPAAPTVNLGVSKSAIPAPRRPGRKAVLFRTGDKISHATFGPGVVEQTIPMGGDMLLTIAFDKGGTRKFLAKTAARFITKL